jgi:hypothetical protein
MRTSHWQRHALARGRRGSPQTGEKRQTWKEWIWEGGAAAFLQTIAAGVGVAFAIVTINSWQRQGEAKHRSEVAFGIVSRTAAAKNVVEFPFKYKTVLGSPDFQDARVRAIHTEALQKRVKALQEKLNELEVQGTIARFTFKNYDLDGYIAGVVQGVKTVRACIDEMERLEARPPSSEEEKASLKKVMNGLHIFELDEEAKAYKADEGWCGLGDVFANAEMVEQMLAPELRMSGRVPELDGYDPGGYMYPDRIIFPDGTKKN